MPMQLRNRGKLQYLTKTSSENQSVTQQAPPRLSSPKCVEGKTKEKGSSSGELSINVNRATPTRQQTDFKRGGVPASQVTAASEGERPDQNIQLSPVSGMKKNWKYIPFQPRKRASPASKSETAQMTVKHPKDSSTTKRPILRSVPYPYPVEGKGMEREPKLPFPETQQIPFTPMPSLSESPPSRPAIPITERRTKLIKLLSASGSMDLATSCPPAKVDANPSARDFGNIEPSAISIPASVIVKDSEPSKQVVSSRNGSIPPQTVEKAKKLSRVPVKSGSKPPTVAEKTEDRNQKRVEKKTAPAPRLVSKVSNHNIPPKRHEIIDVEALPEPIDDCQLVRLNTTSNKPEIIDSDLNRLVRLESDYDETEEAVRSDRRNTALKETEITESESHVDKKEGTAHVGGKGKRFRVRDLVKSRSRLNFINTIDIDETLATMAATKTVDSHVPKRRAHTEVEVLDSPPRKKSRNTVRNNKRKKAGSEDSEGWEATSKQKVIKKKERSRQTYPFMLPNRFILRDGNTPAFQYTYLSGKKVKVTQYDLYHMSTSRLLNDNCLSVSADLMFRELKIGPHHGFEWIEETYLIEEFMKAKPNLKNHRIPVPRWQSILGSKILFVPLFKNNHWSLVVFANCAPFLKMILDITPSGKRKRGLIQIVCVHFDSLLSIHHREHIDKLKKFLTMGLRTLWSNKYKDADSGSSPDVERLLSSSLRILHANVDQQTDTVSCGWRTIRHALHIAEKLDGRAGSLKQLANEHLDLSFRGMSLRCINKVLNLSRPSFTDIPTMLYPLHSLVDEQVFGFFNATPADLSQKMLSYLESNKGEGNFDDNTRRTTRASVFKTSKIRVNATKKAQWDALRTVSENVLSAMKENSLNKKQAMRKQISMSDPMCREIAKYLFHYPRGKQFAECLYYTRYSYPDSFLVCLGLEVLFSPKPHIFGESIAPSPARSRRSRTVHFQMSMLRDQARGMARYYDELSRFRLQEMAEHFKGVAENVLKSCCKLAQTSGYYQPDGADVSDEKDMECTEEEVPASNVHISDAEGKQLNGSGEEDEDFINLQASDDGQNECGNASSKGKLRWDFSTSITFLPPTGNELGTITSNVSPRDLDMGIDTCLKSADKVANEAIMSKVSEFEKICKRKLQFENRSLKVSKVKQRATGVSLASIPHLFANNFARLLKEEVMLVWGKDLPIGFEEGSLDEIIRRLLSAANKLFERNGRCFFNLTGDVLDKCDDEVKLPVLEKKRSIPEITSAEEDVPVFTLPKDESGTAILSTTKSTSTIHYVSFGLSTSIELLSQSFSVNTRYTELLAALFHVLRNCRPHRRSEASHCGDFALGKWGSEPALCQKDLFAIQKAFKANLSTFERSARECWSAEDVSTLRMHVQELKLKILRRVSADIADPIDPIASSEAVPFRSEIFCYKVPKVSNEFSDVVQGKKFNIFYGNGQGTEEVSWEYEVTEMSCHPVSDNAAQVFRCEDCSVLGGVKIPTSDVPSFYVLKANIKVHCTADLWDESDFEVRGDQYLGFRIFDLVKVVFSFQGVEGHATCPHPLSTNYSHSLIGFLVRHPNTNERSDKGQSFAARMRRWCVGPRTSGVDILVADDIASSSGSPVSLPQFVERWQREDKATTTTCRVIPVEGVDTRKDIWRYGSLEQLLLTPKIFRLSLVDSRFAEAYELERRKKHYHLMKNMLSQHPSQYLSFKARKTLEDEWRQRLRQALRPIDPDLNEDQLQVIENVLYGWKTHCSPNEIEVLEQMTESMRGFMTSGLNAMSLTISRDDLEWWGSRVCYMEGAPGTGKTRTISALICTVLQNMEAPSSLYDYTGAPRVLVITATVAAADKMFVMVCNLFHRIFEREPERYNNAVNMMIRVGSLTGKAIVRSREVLNIAESGSGAAVIDKARAVFVSAESLFRTEHLLSTVPYSLLIVDDAVMMQEESLIFAVSQAFVRGIVHTYGIRRVSILISGDRKQSPLDTSREKHFFHRAMGAASACELSLRISLSRQYRMAPPIAECISTQFYGGTVSTIKEKDTRWEEDDLFKSLRRNKRFPIRNLVVIDTSLEEGRATESSDSARSFYNMFEVTLISSMVAHWAHCKANNSFEKRITVLCMYSKQCDEVTKALALQNLRKVHVGTLDELLGLENDILILSLVRTSTDLEPDGFSHEQWINIAASRARQSAIFIGSAKHFGKRSSQWAQFFRHCLSHSKDGEDATHGFFRPRYIDGKEPLRLSSFSPPYITA